MAEVGGGWAWGGEGMGTGNGSFSEKGTKGIFIFSFAYLYFLIFLQLCNSFFTFESDKLFICYLSGNPDCVGPDQLFELDQTPTYLSLGPP